MRVRKFFPVWSLLPVNCLIAIALMGFGPPKLVDREAAATIRLTTGELNQWYRAAQPPDITADALLVYDVDAGRTLYSRNADSELPQASLTKLMTALIVLEAERFQEQVSIEAGDLVGGATMGLSEGETVTVDELLWGLLVASGNDAAMALARHHGGDVDRFVAAMNDRARELGLDETTYANPHGFDDEGHVSSASDVLALALRLMQYPLFMDMVGTSQIIAADRELANTNEMLGLYPGADGIKTGTSPLAGQCLVLSINDDGRRIILVVLGSDDRYGDVRALHSLYLSNYEWVEGTIEELSVLNRLYGEDGELIPLRESGDPVTILRHRWGDPKLAGFRNIAKEEASGLETAEPVGVVEWRSGDELIGENELMVR